jgi:hypothetical protein
VDLCLRTVSGGTSYCQSRLAFFPYTQVTPKICTSLRLPTSTPISRGFIVPRHRSAGFGYSMIDLTRAHADPGYLRSFGFPAAPAMIALASPTTKTPWGVIHNERTDTAPRPYGRVVAVMPRQPVTGLCVNPPRVFFGHGRGYPDQRGTRSQTDGPQPRTRRGSAWARV